MTTEVANLVARLRADTSEYTAGIAKAISADETLIASQKKKVAQFTEVGAAMSKYVTLPIVALGAASVLLRRNFDDSFAHIAAATQLPAAGLAKLENQVLAIAKSTAQSPTGLAQTMVAIERSGVGAANAVGVLNTAAKLSAAHLGEQGQSANVVTSVMNAYGAANISAAASGDILAKGAETSKLTVDDLSASLGRALPAAAQLGVSFKDLIAAEAAMSKEGLSAGQAGMSLFRILSAIESPSSTGAKALAQLGISAQQAQEMIKHGDFEGLLLKLASASKGNEQAILQLTGGIRGASGAFALLGDSGKNIRTEFDAMNHSTGSLDEALHKVQQTTGYQVQAAIVSVEVGLIKLGAAFSPVVKGLGQLVGGFGDVIGFIGDLNPGLRDFVVYTLAAAAAIGPLILIAGGLAKALLAIKEAGVAYQAWLAANTAKTAEKVAADEAAGDAAVERAAKEQVLTDALIEQAGAESVATEAAAVRTGGQLALFGGQGENIPATQQEQLPMVLPAPGAGAATGEELLAPTAALGAFATTLTVVGVAAAGLVALHYNNKYIQETGQDAQASSQSMKDLYAAVGTFNSLPAPQQQKDLAALHGLIKQTTDAYITMAAAQKALADNQSRYGQPGGPNQTADFESGAGSVTPAQIHPEALDKLHEKFQQVIADQGLMAARPFFKEFMSEVARIPGASQVVNTVFHDIRQEFLNAHHDAVVAAEAIGHQFGESATTAAGAMRAYDSALGDANNITDLTRAAGEKAAVALHSIGIAAGFAAQATVNGMSTAEIAVAGLVASVNAQLAQLQAGDSLASALQQLQQAQIQQATGTTAQTATAAAIEHAQKEQTVRDSLLGVQQAALGVQQAELGLAQAHEQVREAAQNLTDAEKTYETVLHGVAAGSREAAAAQDTYAQAKNDAAMAGLDTAQARRNLEQIKNDKKLLDFAVADARQKLHDDLTGAGGTEHWVVTPTGSKMEMVGGEKASPEQIAKDRIALKDAQIAQSGAADSVRRAQIELSNAEIHGRESTRALADAARTLNGILHGYPPNSKEARDATNNLANAMLNQIGAAQGLEGAQLNLVSSQNQVITASINLQRAQADLAGQLNNQTATAFQNVQTATHGAENAFVQYATSVANASGFRANTVGWAHAFLTALQGLQQFLHPSGPLGTFLDQTIMKFALLANPVGPPTGTAAGGTPKKVGVGNTNVFAAGGAVPGNDENGIHILAHPGEYVVRRKAVEKYGLHMMERINAGAMPLPRFAAGGQVTPDALLRSVNEPGSYGAFETRIATNAIDQAAVLIQLAQFISGSAPAALQQPGPAGGWTGGTVANLPPGMITRWAHDFAVGLGDVNPSAQIINEIATWAHRESGGGGGMFNPLNTTLAWPGATDYNSVGVKNYPSYDAGLRASIATFSESQWAGVKAAIDANNTGALAAAVNAEYASWGGGPILAAGGMVPRMAKGGRFSAGQAIWVGEEGPELARFGSPGEIIPHHSAGGGGTVVHQTVELTIQALDPSTTADIVIPALRDYTRTNTVISGVRTE